jgi:glyoxylase-like metal-dependent hydrolase (beta-lactamase superfamily II)
MERTRAHGPCTLSYLRRPLCPPRVHHLECFYGDYHASPMAMDYFVWALTNGTETVVVDLGFTEAVGTRRGRQFLRCPSNGLAELGIDCPAVQHVILTHFHYDHVGNYALFPHATFYVQDAEMVFYTGRHASQGAFRHAIEVDDVCALVRLNYERRLAFVGGSREIVPGIAVYHVGGHPAFWGRWLGNGLEGPWPDKPPGVILRVSVPPPHPPQGNAGEPQPNP